MNADTLKTLRAIPIGNGARWRLGNNKHQSSPPSITSLGSRCSHVQFRVTSSLRALSDSSPQSVPENEKLKLTVLIQRPDFESSHPTLAIQSLAGQAIGRSSSSNCFGDPCGWRPAGRLKSFWRRVAERFAGICRSKKSFAWLFDRRPLWGHLFCDSSRELPPIVALINKWLQRKDSNLQPHG